MARGKKVKTRKIASEVKPKKRLVAKAALGSKKIDKTLFQSVKGMHDVLPQDQPWWDRVRQEAWNLADFYGFKRISTPIVEKAVLFERAVGEATEIVEKQMFYLKSNKVDLVLRPEGTAPIMRSFLEHGLSHWSQPLKLFYFEPMFRHEQPQDGRFRQFNQVGFEIIGDEPNAIYDAQIINISYRLLEELKINNLAVKINTLGCKNCRSVYRRRLFDYFKNQPVCKDCSRRMSKNPLRLLDCKEQKCRDCHQDAPTILNNLCDGCSCHFKTVLEYLGQMKISYELDHCLVRGLDYYSRTVFEIFSGESELALMSGGRYDGLAEQLGGKAVPAVGAAAGVERLVRFMKEGNIRFSGKKKSAVFLIHIGNEARKKSLSLIEELRQADIKVVEALTKNSLKSQLRQADKEKLRLALIFGQKEAFEDSVIIRDMGNGSQETVPLSKFAKEIKKKLR